MKVARSDDNVSPEDLLETTKVLVEKLIVHEGRVTVTLRERGISWDVTEQPSKLWLEWASGKGGWDFEGPSSPPKWAADLRGTWDNAWAD